MKYKTDCPCYSEVYMGNPGGVPHCSQYGLEPDCENCKRPKRTKADRIRAMTDEELAEWINDLFYGFLDNPGRCEECVFDSIDRCTQCWLEWLRQEVKDK